MRKTGMSRMADEKPEVAAAVGEPPRNLTPEAQRALAEAEARRKAAAEAALPKDLGGRDGPEPARYGDWENKGIAVDF